MLLLLNSRLVSQIDYLSLIDIYVKSISLFGYIPYIAFSVKIETNK